MNTPNVYALDPSAWREIPKLSGGGVRSKLGNLWGAIKAHPYKTGLTGLNAAGNIAGLTDNNKFLGQALGALGGGLIGAAIPGAGALGITNAAMLGGNLGSLFDVLSAKKDQEQEQLKAQQLAKQMY